MGFFKDFYEVRDGLRQQLKQAEERAYKKELFMLAAEKGRDKARHKLRKLPCFEDIHFNIKEWFEIYILGGNPNGTK